mgnify:CR=1 FL=1
MERVATGFQFTEGPVFSRIGFLLFSDIPAERIYKLERGKLSVFRENSRGANGLSFDRQGRLLTCEGKAGRVTRTEKDSSLSILADRFEGKRFWAPNDLVYAIDGSIYFTDPMPRQAAPDPTRTGFSAVYQITRHGEVRLATREPARPNGVALSPNQLVLYVADSGADCIRAYEISGDGGLTGGRLFAPCRRPDGLKTDEAGNLYVAAEDGIAVFSPEGKLRETISVPERPSNLNWGPGFYGLYITARTSVYFLAGRGPGTRTY